MFSLSRWSMASRTKDAPLFETIDTVWFYSGQESCGLSWAQSQQLICTSSHVWWSEKAEISAGKQYWCGETLLIQILNSLKLKHKLDTVDTNYWTFSCYPPAVGLDIV